MKTKIAAILVAAVSVVSTALADYQVTFNTANGGLTNPVFDVGGSTRLDSTFFGQIYAGTAGNLVAIGTAKNFGTVGGTVNSGANGFIIDVITSSGTSAIVAANTIQYELRAWKGAATYELAQVTAGAKIGNSVAQNITVQGPPSLTTPPNTDLHASFTLSTVAVPEPATLALGLFGAAGLLFRRRK